LGRWRYNRPCRQWERKAANEIEQLERKVQAAEIGIMVLIGEERRKGKPLNHLARIIDEIRSTQ
jgi:hypothetical protein